MELSVAVDLSVSMELSDAVKMSVAMELLIPCVAVELLIVRRWR